jgi:hypothetical protein
MFLYREAKEYIDIHWQHTTKEKLSCLYLYHFSSEGDQVVTFNFDLGHAQQMYQCTETDTFLCYNNIFLKKKKVKCYAK